MIEHYDVIVVGAGIFGSCAAYHCQIRGLQTLLIEQFELGHSHGSSHGKSRITRYAHTEAEYIPLVDDSYKQIDELQRITEKQLWRATGLLWVASNDDVSKMSNILKKYQAKHETLKGSEITSRYPQFSFEDDNSGLVDPMGGVLFADLILKAFQTEFQRHGGTIHENETLLNYVETAGVDVETTKKNYTADKLILTVGSWVSEVVTGIPIEIQTTSINVCYWEAKSDKMTELTEMSKFPVFVGTNNNCQIYGLPSIDYPGAIKLCSHEGEPIHSSQHPDTPNQDFVKDVANYIEKYLPSFNHSSPAKIDRCKYTNSKDGHYVIDFLPASKNIILGACGSGCGFKVGPAIGKVLADMATGKPPSIDVSFFSIGQSQKRSK